MATEDQFTDSIWGGEQLQKIPLLSGLTSQELCDLYSQGSLLSLPKLTNVIIEGEFSRGLYLLLSGTLTAYKHDKTTLVPIGTLEPGAVFGELSLLEAAPRTATVTAQSEAYAFNLELDVFERYRQSQGDEFNLRFFQHCAQVLAQECRRQNDENLLSQQLLWKHALKQH